MKIHSYKEIPFIGTRQSHGYFKVYILNFLKNCRTVFAYHWVRIKASPAVLEKNKLSLGRNSYNKSLAHAKWLVAACHRALNYVEQNGILT